MDIPQRESTRSGLTSGHRILVKRNCSISPAGLLAVFSVLALVSLGIGVAFAFAGAWLVLPFAGLEVAVLAVAFLVTARHAADREQIVIEGRRLQVEVVSGRTQERMECDARLARVAVERSRFGSPQVWINAPGRRLELGRHWAESQRVRLADALNRSLRI